MAHCWSGVAAECIEDADRVDLGGQAADVLLVGPAEGRGLVGDGQLSREP
jgi:hypothetical protein